MKVLIVYASKHGSTREVAERISGRLQSAGMDVTCSLAADVSTDRAAITESDAVLIGSAIYAGSWMRDAAAFVDRFAAELATTQVWAFSCGPVGAPLAPAERPKAADATTAKARAIEHRVFPGVVDRSGYNLAERGIVAVLRVPDGDYRVWSDIDEWADSVAAKIG